MDIVLRLKRLIRHTLATIVNTTFLSTDELNDVECPCLSCCYNRRTMDVQGDD